MQEKSITSNGMPALDAYSHPTIDFSGFTYAGWDCAAG